MITKLTVDLDEKVKQKDIVIEEQKKEIVNLKEKVRGLNFNMVESMIEDQDEEMPEKMRKTSIHQATEQPTTEIKVDEPQQEDDQETIKEVSSTTTEMPPPTIIPSPAK